jgi:hypothetical protein
MLGAKTVQTIAYVALLILMLGIGTGWIVGV